jgi:hypothetical protein
MAVRKHHMIGINRQYIYIYADDVTIFVVMLNTACFHVVAISQGILGCCIGCYV